MKISNFYFYWAFFRWGFVGLAIVVMIILAITGNTWTLELEYIGPGSEYSRLEAEHHKHENERSKERCEQGCAEGNDWDASIDWDKVVEMN